MIWLRAVCLVQARIIYGAFKKAHFREVSQLSAYAKWDLMLSAYNTEHRVQAVFDAVTAERKEWIILPAYGAVNENVPNGAITSTSVGGDEATTISEILDAAEVRTDTRLCIDATGVLRQYLLVLLRALQFRGITCFDVVYSEPSMYGQKETTEFSSAELIQVRQVNGFEGSHSTDTSKDLLVIGAGYEHRLVAAVSDEKNHAAKRLLYAFPSLRPDMFQESALATFQAHESVGRDAQLGPFFAPAYDPFVTAQALSDLCEGVDQEQGGITNLYLAPLSTKPIAIGFALYYLLERMGKSTSIINPFMGAYANRAAEGISRIWLYHIELPYASE